MTKRKRKLTASEKAEKRRRREQYMIVFIGGKQKRIRRPPTVDGMGVDEFIRLNADPIFLHQNEMWEYMEESDRVGLDEKTVLRRSTGKACQLDGDDDDDIPF